MASRLSPRRGRRARRGSLERPVNARLYRASYAVVALALVVLLFSFTRPGPLPAPVLPANFDGEAARALALDLAGHFPDRSPGGPGSLRAAQWFRDQMRQYNLKVASDVWTERVAGLGRVRLDNLWAVAPGQSRDAIVVLAHRDDTGTGPGADDDASGTAALVELARGYAESAGAAGGVRSAHTIVFLSTDGGAFGAGGAARFAAHPPFPVIATIALTAIGGRGAPRVDIAGDEPRSPAASLVVTASKRVLEQTGRAPERTSILGQLVDLGFPLTLYEQGPFVARGIPAITLTTSGARPPQAFTDRAGSISAARLTQLGRATQQLLGSLDGGIGLAPGTSTYVWTGARVVRGWAIELVLFSLLVPFAVPVVDLFAHCRRRRIPLGPALASLRSRLAVWLFAGLVFYVFRLLGAWPGGAARPPNPATATAGDWPVVALLGFGAISFLGWLVAHPRLVPRRDVGPDERLAGQTAALLCLGVVSLLVLATNPYALLFFLPPLHVWLWLPHVRERRRGAALLVLLVGLIGPALLLLSLGIRFGLGLDAPWYLVELAAVGYVHLPAVAITLAGSACAAQLAAITVNRYGPYPDRRDRPARGPIREVVRTLVVTVRTQRRRARARRRAVGES